MRVVGLITEYNPFHNGHLFHYANSKEITGADYSIAVMSGNFLQRGEPALFNKWARAAMAVVAGVDLVLELPFVYATRSAQYFAHGAVDILDKTGIVTDLCFGSELGNVEPLSALARLLADEPDALKTLIKEELTKGVILPVAQTNALSRFLATDNVTNAQDLTNVMGNPNNILGIEYIRALINLNSSITPQTVKRTASQYHDKEFNGNIASATGIREYVKSNGLTKDDLIKVMPEKSFDIMEEEIINGRGPVFTDYLSLPLISRLRTIDAETLAKIFDVNEGLENRIIDAAKDSTNFDQLVNNIKSKRYTWTRIQRILIHALLNFTKEVATSIDNTGGSQYLRVLAFSNRGKILLHRIKNEGKVPLITKVTTAQALNQQAKNIINYDIKATDLYTALYPNPAAGLGRLDYMNSPVVIK